MNHPSEKHELHMTLIISCAILAGLSLICAAFLCGYGKNFWPFVLYGPMFIPYTFTFLKVFKVKAKDNEE